MKKTLFSLFLVFFSFFIQAQETIISGKITDANTNEPIPFANVYFKGTTKGTTTDFDGNYTLKENNPTDSLTVKVLGYIPKVKLIKKKKTQLIDYQLTPTSFNLNEVLIESGENPSWQILREVWKRKDAYNMANLEALQYESYVNVDISIDNISEKFRNNRTMKPFAAVFDSLKKAAGEDGKVVLPFLVSESIADVYTLGNPIRYKEIIKANKLSGLLIDSPELFAQFLGSSFQKYNFYDNWLKIFDRSFISPIARGALGFYEIYIMDTVVIDGKSCFELKVKAKRKEDLAFNGKMWITDSTFALKRISVEIGKAANLNFIERYSIQQDYLKTDAGAYVPERTRVLVDVTEFTENSVGVIMKFNINNKNFITNKPKESKFYAYNLEIEQNSMDYDDKYWKKERLDRANDSTVMERAYSAIDTIRESPRIKFWRVFINTAWEGFYKVGKIDVGHWITLYGHNKNEGNRFQLNLRTNPDFSKYWIAQTQLAYGTKDEKWKYNLQLEHFLSRKSWTKIGIKRSYDVERLGIDPAFLEEHIFINIMFSLSSQLGYLDKSSLNYTNRLWFETDLGKGLNHKIILENKDFNPQGDFNFAYFKKNSSTPISSYKLTTVSYSFQYAPKNIWLIKDNYRIGMSAKQGNVWTFKYTLGLKDILGGDFNYQKFSLNLARKWKLGALGQLNYSITATKVFGQVPYTLGVIFQGNETFFESERSYNMLNYVEFAADQSIDGLVMHHFQGLFFNRIPLFKRLKLREVVGANFILSSLDKKNNYKTIDNPDGIMAETFSHRKITHFSVMSFDKPYVEAFWGIENLFKLIRITAYHRLTYLDEPDVPHLFGIKGFYIKGSLFLSL
ncbi:MAG: DUF5686 family protein [Bacteroidales bacterium]